MSRKTKETTPLKPAGPRRRGKGKPRELSPFNKSFTIPQFCQRNPMSRNTYYKMREMGRGPAEIRPTHAARGGIVLISEEAEGDWRAKREAESAAEKAGAR